MEMGREALMAASTAIDRLDAFRRRMAAADIDLADDETDSSAVAALAVAAGKEVSKVRSYSIGFEDSTFDESSFSNEVACFNHAATVAWNISCASSSSSTICEQ